MYSNLKWTKLTYTICLIPCLLTFIAMHLMATILADTLGAIISNSDECAEIGKHMFEEGGSAVDAAVAVMFCEGVVSPKEISIGGGFTGLIYMGGRMESLIATPTTPLKALELISENQIENSSQAGGVPGQLLGYWEMHKKHGLLPWKKLIEPSIDICQHGINISRTQSYLDYYYALKFTKNDSEPDMLPEPINGTIKLPILGRTLQKIADEGVDAFYNGDVGRQFVKDIQNRGGFLTMEDLRNFKVEWSKEVVTFNLPYGLKAYTTPLPSSGIIVALVMNIMKSYKDINAPVYWHRFVEASKHALGIGLSLDDVDNENDTKKVEEKYKKMLDIDFAREIRSKIYDDKIIDDERHYSQNENIIDSGFSQNAIHISVLGPNGDSVTITSSLMMPCCTMFRSPNTGIYWNDELKSPWQQFGLNRNKSIFGKRSLSPHAPVIVIPRLKSRPFLTIGAIGGHHIYIQVLTALIRYCIMRQSISLTVNSGYYFPHIKSRIVEYDDDAPNVITKYLEKVGHEMVPVTEFVKTFGIVCISSENNHPLPEHSRRQPGGVALIKTHNAMATFILIVLIFLGICILMILIRDYLKADRNRVTFADTDL